MSGKQRRQRLKEHDGGRNRHNRGVAYLDKLARAHVERSRQRSRKVVVVPAEDHATNE